MSGWILQVRGMTCSSCAKNIQNILCKVEGVDNVSVNVVLGSVVIEGLCSKEQVVKAVESIGFKVLSCIPSSAHCSIIESPDEGKLIVPTDTLNKDDSKKEFKRVKTGVASLEDYLDQVPTVQFVLQWNNAEAAEKCTMLLKNLIFVKQVSLSTTHDARNDSNKISFHCLRALLERLKQYFTKRPTCDNSIFLITVVVYDFRNFYPEDYLREQFSSWQMFVEEMRSTNIKAAIYAYLSSHLRQFSWQTDCKMTNCVTEKNMMESVKSAMQCVYEEGKKWRDRFLYCAFCSIPLFLIVLSNPSSFLVLQVVLATFVQFYGGYPFYRGAFHVLKHSMRANMAVLITTSTFIAYLYSLLLCCQRWFFEQTIESRLFMPMFETGSMLITVVLFGKWIESNLKIRASLELEQIGELLPSKVNLVLYNGPIEMVDFFNASLLQVESSIIEPGDIIQVESGFTIPVDGKVVSGSSFVDESFLTGEPFAVQKGVNDVVYAGAVNISHSLFITATSVGSKTSVEEIWRLWTETQLSKAPTEQLVDKISAIFVPTVLLLSFGVFLCWWLCLEYSVVPMDWWENEGKVLFCLYFCLSAMVIACPCALGLAAPMAYMIASFTALRHGIVYRDISTLIAFVDDVQNVVFDKTGTLTLGRPLVTACHELSDYNPLNRYESCSYSVVWSLVEELESQCVHPIAKAVTEYVRNSVHNNKNNEKVPFTLYNLKEQTGMGMEAEFQSDDQKYSIMIGQKDWILTQCLQAQVLDHSDTLKEALIRLEQLNSRVQNETLLLVALNHIPIRLLMIEDAIRPEAHETIDWLQNKQSLSCWLLSGDNYKSARHVARAVGIQERHIMAKLQPWQKWQWIQTKMKEERDFSTNKNNRKKVGRIVFVGDGLNDAPALAQADIGIAMGNSSPVSYQTAAVVLKRNDLKDVITAFDLAKKVKRTIYWNYAWSMLYNLLAFPLAAGVLFPLWRIRIPPFLAAAAMGLSSISVMVSSLRLKNYRSPVESLSGPDHDIELQLVENEGTQSLIG